MNDFRVIEFEELKKEMVSYDSFLSDLAIADIKGEEESGQEKVRDAVRVNALIIMLVTEGSCEMEIDYTRYTVATNTIVTIMPTHVVRFMKFNPGLKGRTLVVSRSFLEQANQVKHSSNIHYMHIRKNPCTLLEAAEIAFLDQCLQSIREKIRRRTHLLQRELLQNALLGFFIEVGNIMMSKGGYVNPPILSRREELLDQFLQLLFEHCKEEHGVTFYAEKMFITPQYLSLVLKEQTGKSANKWIDEALLVEAKILLKAPQMTVQRVADILRFSDQSTFGKFFKKHTGLSPMEFRRN